MKNEPKQICPCCGRPMMRQHHTFNRAIANILLKTAEHYAVGETFRLKDFLSHVEICNFQKLAYFGLAAKHYTTTGEHIGGQWYLTIRALKFIRGEERIEAWVETFSNKVVLRSSETISLWDTTGNYLIPKDYAIAQTPALQNKDHQAEFFA